MNSRRLLLIFMLAALITVFMAVIYMEISEMDKSYQEKQLRFRCTEAAFTLNKLLHDSQNFLELTAKYPIIMDLSLKHLKPFLQTLVQKFEIFTSVYVIDKKGEPLVDATHVPELFDGVPSQVWFTNVVKGYYSDYTTTVYKSDITRRHAITQAVLIRGPLFDLRAVLAAEIDMSYLWENVKRYVDNNSRYKMYLLNNKDEIIYGESKARDGRKKIYSYTGLSKDMISSKSGTFRTSSGRTVGAYCSLRAIDEIKGREWKVVLIKEYGNTTFSSGVSLGGFLNIVIYMILFSILFIILNYILLFFGVGQNEDN